jgi:hypothetical protein
VLLIAVAPITISSALLGVGIGAAYLVFRTRHRQPPPPPTPDGRRPRPLDIVGSFLVAIVVGVVANVISTFLLTGQVSVFGLPESSPTPASAPVANDGDDPKRAPMRCDLTAETVDHADVYTPSGQVFGQLLLRRSPACRTSWGTLQVTMTVTPNRPFKVSVDAHRPKDHQVTRFSYLLADSTKESPVYGNMLRTDKSCVYVEAAVDGGPPTRTGCQM